MIATLGLDIGGANLKAAHTDGSVRVQPFALWKSPDKLSVVLRDVAAVMPAHERLTLTMTGELCDCFSTKKQGVSAILDAAAVVAGNKPLLVWTTAGFVDLAAARANPLPAASANWLVLTEFVCRLVPGRNGVLIDIGSTTSDIIPFAKGRPAPRGWTDTDRLRSAELVYTGVRRTPLCAVLAGGVAAELFATTLDVNLVLDRIAEDPLDTGTADGQPATRAAAHARLARMLCADPETCSVKTTKKLAERALLRQLYQLSMAFDGVISHLPGPAEVVVLAGEGEFLVRLLLSQQNSFRGGQIISLAESLGPEISRAACAYAAAMLAQERTESQS